MLIEKMDEQLKKYVAKQSSPLLVKLLINGIPIVIVYQNGQLEKITMEDENQLELDVTKAVRASRDVPERIPFDGFLKVQAHALHTFSDFEKMNENGEYLHHKDLTKKVLRKQMDCERNKLRVIVTNIVDMDGFKSDYINSELERTEFLLQQGLHVVFHEKINNCSSEEILQYYKTFLDFHRAEIGYSVSGLRIIQTDLDGRNEGIILPFPSDEAILQVEDIHLAVHSSGEVVPAVKIKVTDMAGQRSVSLCLPDRLIKHLDIRIGDQILMEDVHTIIGIEIEKRTGTEIGYVSPDVCPRCGGQLKSDAGKLYCLHQDCRNAIGSILDGSRIKGMTFVITGTLSIRRYEFRKLIEKAGGVLAGVVTNQTDFLIVGSKGIGTVKYRKAESLKIPIITEEQFRLMIE